MALDEGEEVHGVLRATAAMGVPARATVTLFGGAKRPGFSRDETGNEADEPPRSREPTSRGRQCLHMAVRPEGANHQWRGVQPG